MFESKKESSSLWNQMISAPLFLTIAFYPIIQGILSRKKLTIMNDPKKETALCSEPTLIEGGKEGGYWGSKMDTSFAGSLQVHYKFSKNFFVVVHILGGQGICRGPEAVAPPIFLTSRMSSKPIFS